MDWLGVALTKPTPLCGDSEPSELYQLMNKCPNNLSMNWRGSVLSDSPHVGIGCTRSLLSPPWWVPCWSRRKLCISRCCTWGTCRLPWSSVESLLPCRARNCWHVANSHPPSDSQWICPVAGSPCGVKLAVLCVYSNIPPCRFFKTKHFGVRNVFNCSLCTIVTRGTA